MSTWADEALLDTPILAPRIANGPKNSVFVSTLLLAKSMIGAATLSVPFAFAAVGWALGLAFVAGVSLLTFCSLYVLSEGWLRSSASTYSLLIGHYLGFKGSVLTQLCLVSVLFGATVLYIILIADGMQGVIANWYPGAAPHHRNDSVAVQELPWWCQRVSLVLLSMLLLTPLTLARNLHGLRHASTAGNLAILYLAGFIIAEYLWGNTAEGVSRLDISAVVLSWRFALAGPILVGSFCGQFNWIEICCELRQPTRRRLNQVAGNAVLACALVYALVGLCGYLSFGDRTPGNILSAYSDPSLRQGGPQAAASASKDDDGERRLPAPLNLFLLSGQLSVVLSCALTIPLFVFPLRLTLLTSWNMHARRRRQQDQQRVVLLPPPVPAAGYRSFDDLSSPVEPAIDLGKEDEEADACWKTRVALTLIINLLLALTAIFTTDLRVILDFLGSTCSNAISWLLPGALGLVMFRSLERPKARFWQRLSGAMVIVGLLTGFLGLGALGGLFPLPTHS